MVGEFAAVGGKVVVALLESLAKVGIRVNLHIGRLSKLLEVCLVGLGIFNCHGFVRPPCRDNLCAEGLCGNLLVPAEVVGGVVGGAHGLYVELTDEGLAAELRSSELGVALVKDFAGGCGAQELIYAEHTAQFQVSPVVQGVTHGVRHGLGPFLEGFPSAVFAAGEVVLAYAVCTHCAPLVVVSVVAVHKPQLGDVTELDILCYLLRHKVAVVVDDGHLFRVLVVELLGSL